MEKELGLHHLHKGLVYSLKVKRVRGGFSFHGATVPRGLQPFHGTTAPRGLQPFHYQALQSHSAGLLWTSDHLDADTSTCQHSTLTRHRHPWPQRDSIPQSQQVSGRRPTPYTARLLCSASGSTAPFILLDTTDRWVVSCTPGRFATGERALKTRLGRSQGRSRGFGEDNNL